MPILGHGLPIAVVLQPQLAAAVFIFPAILHFAPVALFGDFGQRLAQLMLCLVQGLVKLASQLGQPLRKCLPCPADLAFFPTLALVDDRMQLLVHGRQLLVALVHQHVCFAPPALACRFDGRFDRATSFRQSLLNRLILSTTLPGAIGQNQAESPTAPINAAARLTAIHCQLVQPNSIPHGTTRIAHNNANIPNGVAPSNHRGNICRCMRDCRLTHGAHEIANSLNCLFNCFVARFGIRCCRNPTAVRPAAKHDAMRFVVSCRRITWCLGQRPSLVRLRR